MRKAGVRSAVELVRLVLSEPHDC
ncbi:MAG: hypothetical protein WCC35_15435 [Bradyrhizobium sp.]